MNNTDSGLLDNPLPRLPDWPSTWLVGGLALFCGVIASGCASGKPASASFASVVIPGRSNEQIQSTAVKVFEEAGYKAFRVPGGMMVFEREGTRGQQFAYGGLGGAVYGSAILVRVRAEIVTMVGQDARRLQCKAFIVHDANEGVFEDEQPLANFRRGPYQKLLDEVAAKLK